MLSRHLLQRCQRNSGWNSSLSQSLESLGCPVLAWLFSQCSCDQMGILSPAMCHTRDFHSLRKLLFLRISPRNQLCKWRYTPNRKWAHILNNTKKLCSFVVRVWDNFCKPFKLLTLSNPKVCFDYWNIPPVKYIYLLHPLRKIYQSYLWRPKPSSRAVPFHLVCFS